MPKYCPARLGVARSTAAMFITVIKLKSDFAVKMSDSPGQPPRISYSGISFVDRHVAITSAPIVSFKIVTAHLANLKRTFSIPQTLCHSTVNVVNAHD